MNPFHPLFDICRLAFAMYVANEAHRICSETESRSGFRVLRYTVAPDAYSDADWQLSSLLALYSSTLSIVVSENFPRSTVPFCAFVTLMPSM